MGSNRSKAAPRDLVRSADNRLRAFELRKQGLSYRAIAKEIGVSPMTAHTYVVKYLEGIRRKIDDVGEDVLTMELQRLDALIESLTPAAMSGDPAAVDRYLKVMDRRAKYLGLDAPESMQVSGSLGLRPEYDLSKLSSEELIQMRRLAEKSSGEE